MSVNARVTEYQGKAAAGGIENRARAAGWRPSPGTSCRPPIATWMNSRVSCSSTSARCYDRDYSALLETIFGDPHFFEIFTTAPAAKVYHHAYLGGLMEHTVAVAEMCDFVAQQYGRVDRDLLLTAALLHDVGKTRSSRSRPLSTSPTRDVFLAT